MQLWCLGHPHGPQKKGSRSLVLVSPCAEHRVGARPPKKRATLRELLGSAPCSGQIRENTRKKVSPKMKCSARLLAFKLEFPSPFKWWRTWRCVSQTARTNGSQHVAASADVCSKRLVPVEVDTGSHNCPCIFFVCLVLLTVNWRSTIDRPTRWWSKFARAAWALFLMVWASRSFCTISKGFLYRYTQFEYVAATQCSKTAADYMKRRAERRSASRSKRPGWASLLFLAAWLDGMKGRLGVSMIWHRLMLS